jgi:hypothetical protein
MNFLLLSLDECDGDLDECDEVAVVFIKGRKDKGTNFMYLSSANVTGQRFGLLDEKVEDEEEEKKLGVGGIW